jgi:hypothetical protein
MPAFKTWLATSPYASALKVGIGFLLTAALLTWTSEGTLSLDHWQTWLIGALGVAVPIVVNILNPADTRYGKGS